MAIDVKFLQTTRAKFDTITPAAGSFYRVRELDGSESFYQGSNKLDRNDLDVAEFALASEASGVVTIKGIKETDGKIAVGTDTTKDITLAKVATTGAAEDVSVADVGGYLTATDVEGALAELAQASAGGVASKTVYITETAGQSADAFSKRYGVYQGANGSASSPVAGEKLVDIDIPKDMVVEDGSVVDITFNNGHLYDGATDVTEIIKGAGGTATAADAGKYIKLEIANAASSVLYIAAKDLVDVYTAEQNATQIQLVIDSSNVISATVVAGSIGSTELASNAVITAKIADDAVTADKVSIAAHSETQTAGADGLALSVTTTDGQVSAVSGSIAANTYDAYGAAAAAVAALDTTNDVVIASKSGDIVTLKAGVKQEDGLIAQGTGSDIALAAVAATGLGTDVSYDNTSSGLTAVNIQEAVDEVALTAGGAVQSVTTGSTNGTIDVDGTDVAVYGLGSAAYENTSAFDAAGSAAAVQSNLETALTWEEIS